MTQRLIGAVSNKRMECAVFWISGRFCRKRWLYRRCVFFSVHDGTKSALTMRENLPFSVKSVLRSKKNYIKRIAASNGKIVWFRTEKSVFAVRLIKNRETSPARGALCFTVNTQNIERFLCAGKCCCRLALIDDKGCAFVHSAWAGRGGQRFSKNQFGWRERCRFPFMRRILLSTFIVRLLPFRAKRKKRDLVFEELSENAFCAVAARSQNMPFTYRWAQKQRNCVGTKP